MLIISASNKNCQEVQDEIKRPVQDEKFIAVNFMIQARAYHQRIWRTYSFHFSQRNQRHRSWIIYKPEDCSDHGGEITVKSEVGKGSIFTVYLPMKVHSPDVIASVAFSSTNPAEAESYPGRRLLRAIAPAMTTFFAINYESSTMNHERKGGFLVLTKILVVDDEKFITLFLKQHLEKEGYEVFYCRIREEGLEVFRTEIPDIILLDIHLPGISGLETLEAVRKINKEVIVVIIILRTEI